jgi:hypothetical protein
MTRKKQDFGATLKARRALVAKLKAEAVQKLVELESLAAGGERELRELEQLQSEIAEFERAFDKALNWPKDQPIDWDYRLDKKTGKMRDREPVFARRPNKWKGRHGYEFVSNILAIQARDNCNQAEAIRRLKDADPKKWPGKQRQLEKVFGKIVDYWGGWYRWKMELEAKKTAFLAKIDSQTKIAT